MKVFLVVSLFSVVVTGSKILHTWVKCYVANSMYDIDIAIPTFKPFGTADILLVLLFCISSAFRYSHLV